MSTDRWPGAARHSLLPWVFRPMSGKPHRGRIISACKGWPEKIVAEATGQETADERLANAELIVRAVNNHDALVAALLAARPYVMAARDYDMSPRGKAFADETLGRVNAALAAAEASLPPVGEE